MNDLETQIVSALATRRGFEPSSNSKLATRSHRGSSGTRPPFQNRQANESPNVMGTVGTSSGVRNPWPDRPRFSRRGSISLETARAVASRPIVVFGMVVFMATGLMNVAQKSDSDVRVVVHTLWPL